MDDDDDDDEYEVVGYADDRTAHAAHASTSLHSTHTTPKTTRKTASKTSSAARKAPPFGFDWHGDGSKPAWGEGEDDDEDDAGEDGERDRDYARDATRVAMRDGDDVRTKDLFGTLADAVEDVDDIEDERNASPVRGGGGGRAAGDAPAESSTPRRSPRIRRASISASLSGTPNGDAARKRARTSEGADEREVREAALLAEALGVSTAQAEATRAAMVKKAPNATGDAQGGGGKAKKAPRAKKPKEPKKAPADKPSRAKAKVPAPSGGSVLGRLNLLTQPKAPLMMRAIGGGDKTSAEACADANTLESDDTANTAPSTVVEDEIAMDDIVDDDVDDGVDDGDGNTSDADDVPMTMPQTNEAAPTGLGALSRLPKMSSPTFIPRSSVGASINSQRNNRSRNAGLLTTRLQRVLANAKAQHAQFLKRVGSAQPPSSRGALLFYINAARLDASMTNCAGAICDLEKATNTDGEEDVEFARAIVIFNSAQAQELGLERGRRVAIYPPWREVDLPEVIEAGVNRRDATTDVAPRVILCCENVLRLD